MDSEVAAKFGTNASAFGKSNLANDDLANTDFFATKKLNTQALALAVPIVFASSTSFYMTHFVTSFVILLVHGRLFGLRGGRSDLGHRHEQTSTEYTLIPRENQAL